MRDTTPIRRLCSQCAHPLTSAADVTAHNRTTCLYKRPLEPPYHHVAILPTYRLTRHLTAEPREVLRDA